MQTLILGILHVFLKISLLKRKRQAKEGGGMEGPEKSVSCGWRKVEGKRGGYLGDNPTCQSVGETGQGGVPKLC